MRRQEGSSSPPRVEVRCRPAAAPTLGFRLRAARAVCGALPVLLAFASILAPASAAAIDPFSPPPPDPVRGPALFAVGERSATIRWSTAEPSRGAARLWLVAGGAEGRLFEEDGPPRAEHRVGLEGLAPDSLYGYEILSGGVPLAPVVKQRLHTAPPPGEGSLRAVVAGDSGLGSEAQLAVARLMEAQEPDLFLHSGDVFYLNTLEAVLYTPYRALLARAAFVPARGNHDIFLPWRSLFELPGGWPVEGVECGAFDWGPVHFAVLDSNVDFDPQSEQLEWLEGDLASAREREIPWLVLLVHEPPYTVGGHARFFRSTQGVLPEIADRFGVDLVLSGHDHNYQRTHPLRGGKTRDAWQDPEFIRPRGTTYVITGGGGGFLYSWRIGGDDDRRVRVFEPVYHAIRLDVSRERLELAALDVEGATVDSFVLRHSGERPSLEYLRGDVDFDCKVGIADAVSTLQYLFAGGDLDCPAAADSDGSGLPLSIVDPIRVLRHLFLGGPPPPAPYPDCGPDPEADDTGCLRSGCGCER